MRHRMGNKHLNRTSAHAKAMVRNTVVNLFRHERITTTVKKAKLVRRWAEKMITLGKRGSLHARRQALAFLRSKPAVAKLFRTLGPRYVARSGGYTRIIRLAETIRPATSDKSPDVEPVVGCRLGDGAPLAILELVEGDVSASAKRKRRTRPEPFRPRRELYREMEERERREAEKGGGAEAAAEAPEGGEEAPAEEAQAEEAQAEEAQAEGAQVEGAQVEDLQLAREGEVEEAVSPEPDEGDPSAGGETGETGEDEGASG